jgi:hypothetical protein
MMMMPAARTVGLRRVACLDCSTVGDHFEIEGELVGEHSPPMLSLVVRRRFGKRLVKSAQECIDARSRNVSNAPRCRSSSHKPFTEVEMANNQTGSSADRLTHPLLEKLGAIPAAAENLFAYSAKIVCGKQTETNCCCVAGARPGVYATEVNLQNLNLVTAPVVKFVAALAH